MEHSREVIRGFEDMGDGIRRLLGHRVCGRVQMKDLGETLHVFVENQLRHISRECFDGRGEGLTSPHGSYGRVTWELNFSPLNSDGRVGLLTSKNVFVYPRQLDVCLSGVRHNQTVHDSLRYSLRDGVPQEVLNLHRSSISARRLLLFWVVPFVNI